MSHSVPQPSTARAHLLQAAEKTNAALMEEAEQLWIRQLAQSLGTDSTQLTAFANLMRGHRWPVDIGRLFLDSRYAFTCFALAHTSTDEALRRLALTLFDGYQRLETRRKNICLRRIVLH